MVFVYIIVAVLFLIAISIKQINEYQRGIKFTLGKYTGIMGPGWRLIFPIFQSYQKVDLRVKTVDVPSQECVSKDNVSLKVNAVLYYRIANADKAILEVEHYGYAISQLAQTTMRNIVGEFELDDILQKRDEISGKIKEIVDKDTDPWGIKVTKIEIKDIELPEAMKRAMAHQAEAERDRRAKITTSKGEQQSAQNFLDAARIISKDSSALQLRLLHTLSEVAAEKNSTIVLPIPIELLDFIKRKK